MHVVGQTVDLRLARLDGQPGAWTIPETIDLTEVSGLDAASRPDWYIPPNLLPALPTPAPSTDGSAAPMPSSRICTQSVPGKRPTRTTIWRAAACFTAFVTASAIT